MIRAAREALADADALLLEDYNKGALAPKLIAAVMEVARRRGIPVVVDPKYRQFFEYAGATVFKPNRRELESALGASVDLQNRNAMPEVLGPAQGGQPAGDAGSGRDAAGDEGRAARSGSRASRGRSTTSQGRETR